MYDNSNKGVLFKNDQKDNEKAPVYKGKINVRGEDFYLAAWLNTAKSGSKYMSLKVSEITDSEGQAKQQPKQESNIGNDFMDDDVPF